MTERDDIRKAIKDYCNSISSAAVQNSHGEERIYYAGLSLDGLADAVMGSLAPAPKAPEPLAGRAAIEGDAVVIRFPFAFMQSAIDGAWGLNVFARRQKVTDEAEFAKEFCRELNAESDNGTTLIHRMADRAFVNMMEGGAFGFDEHEEQSL